MPARHPRPTSLTQSPGALRPCAVRPLVLALLLAVFVSALGVLPERAEASGSPAVSVSGNRLVDATGAPMRLIGVNKSGTEYACAQGWGIFDGPSDLTSVRAMAKWKVNSVRIPLNEHCWLGVNGVDPALSGANYQKAIAAYVALLHSQGMYAVLELHWSAPGTTKALGQNPMPDADHTPRFWQSVASRFGSDPGVVLDLFNEPYPDGNRDTAAAWTCWRDGGTCAGVSYQVAGMQQLVDVVRGTGATNVIMLSGVRYANSLTQWLAHKPVDRLGQLAAAAHIYGNSACGGQDGGACLTNIVGPVARQVPVVFGETGETYDNSECTSRYTKVILPWADAHGVSYLAWTWNTWESCLALISDDSGTVNTRTPAAAGYATYVHQHLTGLRTTTAPAPSASAPPSPAAGDSPRSRLPRPRPCVRPAGGCRRPRTTAVAGPTRTPWTK